MPNYHHIDHLDQFFGELKVGTRIKKGQLLGWCGKTGTTSPHCHYEVMNKKPDNWLQYTWGMSRAQVAALYLDPNQFVTSLLPMKWNSYGYHFLDQIQRMKNGKIQIGFHPGVDLNWRDNKDSNPGDDDFKLPIYATTDGEIAYLGDRTTDGGAGNNLWWLENTMPETKKDQLDNTVIQLNEPGKPGSGQFALVYRGEKHLVTSERLSEATMTAWFRDMNRKTLTLKEWDAIPTGSNF